MPTPDDAAYKGTTMNLYEEAIKAHQRGDAELCRLLYVNAEMNAVADGDDDPDWHKKPAGDELEW